MQGHFDVFLREAISEENVSFGTPFEAVDGDHVGIHELVKLEIQPQMFAVQETTPNVQFFGFPFEKPVWKRATYIPRQQFTRGDLEINRMTPDSFSESSQNFCFSCYDSSQDPRPDNSLLQINKPKFECTNCNRNFETELELDNHACPDVGKKCQCEVCGKTYRNHCIKARHMLTHSENRPYQCEVCQKSFFRKEYLISHSRVHSGDKPFSCEICGKFMAYASAKRSHMKLHQSKPFSCSACYKNFTSSETLTAVDTELGTLYKCEKCLKSLAESPIPMKSETSLQYEPENAGKDNPRNLKCEYCPRLYIRQSDLTKHSRTHTSSLTTLQLRKNAPIPPPKPFSLEITPQVEIPHLKPEKSSQLDCHLCDKSFIGKKMLTRHVYSHLGIKPYSCEVCAKRYARKEDLTLHIRTHTGERPFSCNMCERKFIRRRSYKLHLRTHGAMSDEIDISVTDNAVTLGIPEN